MHKTPTHSDEQKRLEELYAYKILDTAPEEQFDAITKLASYICQTPISLISLIDKDRLWSKSKIGLTVSEFPREDAFCQYAIAYDDVYEIPNTLEDANFNNSPVVINDPNVRFYAGMPLKSKGGYNVGTLCVMDQKPRSLSPEQKEALKHLASQAVYLFELRIAKEKAEQAAIAKESFLANISHEIRTPMNAIMGFSNLLLESNLESRQQDWVQNIYDSGERLLQSINEILDYSEIVSGKIHLENRPFNLKETLKNLKDRYKTKSYSLDFSFILNANLPDYVVGDRIRLYQILSRLIDNALKFTKQGSVRVTAKLDQEDEKSYSIQFSVRDTGIGIPTEKLEAIFESFTQVNNNSNRQFGGSGLGLSLSKKLVEIQKGKLTVTSEEGKGSEFIFSIAYSKINETLAMPMQKAFSPKKVYQNVRILLCEDNILNQRLAENILNKFGFQMDIAENGKLAIDMLKSKVYDIVLMDIQMPEMNGYEATTAIREQLKLQLPIIAITAHALSDERDKCLALGMNDYISKPFQQEELYNKISIALSGIKLAVSSDSSENVKKKKDGLKVDLTYLKELSEGNREFEKEMIELFIKKTPVDFFLLKRSIDKLDFASIEAVAHKMKSSVSLVGVSVLLELLIYFEMMGKSKSTPTDYNVKLNLLSESMEACFHSLKLILERDYCEI